MLIPEAINELSKRSGKKVTQENIAHILGVSKQAINNRINRETPLKDFEWEKLQKHYNDDYVNALASKLADSVQAKNDVVLNYYPDVFGSCGRGTFVLSEHKEKVSVPKRCIENYNFVKQYSVINAYGDSMMPYIQDKDELIVEHCNGEQIKDNRVYVFRHGDHLFIKRLVLNINQLIIKSDNTMYEPIVLKDQDLEDFEIIGKIVGLFRRMG